MSVLRPLPLSVLVRRAADELGKGAVFDLPARRIYKGFTGLDLSVSFHGHRAATPVGPAAGPHTQLAQNIGLSYLAGGRILELKTVQVNDRLVIGRPCIDMRTVGYNIEWSQELSVSDSLREYAKARLLVAILDELCGIPQAERDVVFDISVGYDLEGIRSRKMAGFFEGARDASAILDVERAKLSRELPSRLRHLADVPCPSQLSDSATLSTFHGCPADEIAGICRFLLSEVGLHAIVKLNPTLLGYEQVEEILHGKLGYREIGLTRAAFDKDLQWKDALSLARDLSEEAARRGLNFGVKLTNTLVVENAGDPLPGREQYLSGEPLHVLSLTLGLRLREELGANLPVSFSAGVDAANVAASVACGFVPVTSCTDLLRPGGYQRLHRQAEALARAMRESGAATVPDFIRARAGEATASGADASLANHRRAVVEVSAAERYTAAKTSTPPRKIGSHLKLFDCINCDKCVPVCPNDANFVLAIPKGQLAMERLVPNGAGWRTETAGVIALDKPWQIGVFADACNECGNCDVFCPEDGAPYLSKPLFFGSVAAWADTPNRDGFAFEMLGETLRMHGRLNGRTVSVERNDDRLRYRGEGFDLQFDPADPTGTAEGLSQGPVDLTPLRIMELLRIAVTAPDAVNFISASIAQQAANQGENARSKPWLS